MMLICKPNFLLCWVEIAKQTIQVKQTQDNAKQWDKSQFPTHPPNQEGQLVEHESLFR